MRTTTYPEGELINSYEQMVRAVSNKDTVTYIAQGSDFVAQLIVLNKKNMGLEKGERPPRYITVATHYADEPK